MTQEAEVMFIPKKSKPVFQVQAVSSSSAGELMTGGCVLERALVTSKQCPFLIFSLISPQIEKASLTRGDKS